MYQSGSGGGGLHSSVVRFHDMLRSHSAEPIAGWRTSRPPSPRRRPRCRRSNDEQTTAWWASYWGLSDVGGFQLIASDAMLQARYQVLNIGAWLLEAEKILITGATGKIAFPIARALAAAGNEVWAPRA